MLHVTIKGLLAHKVRLATTAIAVLIGVAFMSGTLVLTATIGSTFDGLFADINAGTDVVVRGAVAVSGGQGFGDSRAAVDESVLPTVQAVDGVRGRRGQRLGLRPVRRPRRQGHRQSGTRAPRPSASRGPTTLPSTRSDWPTARPPPARPRW